MPKQQIQSIASIAGWLLIARSEDAEGVSRTGDWHIAWFDLFSTKKSALAFAKDNRWPKPYRAVRGQTCVTESTDA